MSEPREQREVIDVDEWDVFCTGVRHCIRIDRSPSPHPKKRSRSRATISSNCNTPVAPESRARSSSRPPSMVHQTALQRITQSELASRIACLDGKARPTHALKIAMSAVDNHRGLKRRETLEIIEISSDSESEIWPSKRQKIDEHVGLPNDTDGVSDHLEDVLKFEPEVPRIKSQSPTQSSSARSKDDDDDDCIDFLAALDISNEANWVSLPGCNKAEDLAPKPGPDADTLKSLPMPPFHVPRRRPPIDYRHVPFDWTSVGPWGIFNRYGITRFPKPFYHARRQDGLSRRCSPSLYYEQGFPKLELTAKYPHLTSGSVNKVVQAQGTVVLCAVAEGGLEDSDDDEDHPPPPAENKPGSLVVYHHGRVYVAPGHHHQRETFRGLATKYYTVYDVAFNPLNSKQFLSSGYDLVVQSWEIDDSDGNEGRKGLNAKHHFSFDSRPQDLVFSPDGSALAVTCHDGTVRMYNQDLFEDMIDIQVPFKKLCVAPKGSGHATGSILWGVGPSKHLLFTSSEPTVKDDHSGFHHAFDICKGTQAVQFDALEAGDATTLSPDGTTLVLFTWGKDTHPVRLYDVRRKVKEAYEKEELEKFKARLCGSEEVNHTSFSPDGRLLAIARSDNALHVYDVRALSRGPLCRFVHHDSDAVGGGGFGVVAAHWIQGRDRVGIVSGGNDGCVRLWEPALGSKSDVQGAVIGRTDFDVAHFSVGDRRKGEFPLVIGDAGGGMHTYDFTNPDGILI